MAIARKVYVISDLHLGGRGPAGGDRGFRMMKHPEALASFIRKVGEKATATVPVELVINGDFVDFLAHEHVKGDRWRPFAYEGSSALTAFQYIAEKGPDKTVFEALAAFVRKHRLTVMLGNHDLELCLPEVRDHFFGLLRGAPVENIRFLHDGEALVVGDALIEHGNAHDPANAVDFDGLRYLRAIRTRGYVDVNLQKKAFRAPAGSELVATIMNPLKERYTFIDLLKPESEALFSLLLAIEPAARGELLKLAGVARGVAQNSLPKPGFPTTLANVSAGPTDAENDPDALGAFLRDLEPTGAAAAEQDKAASLAVQLENVSFGSWLESEIGFARSFEDRGEAGLKDRLPALRQAWTALEDNPTWKLDVEAGKRYWKAARALAASGNGRDGYRFVVFGHTHHAKRVDLDDEGATYLNSGTWANLLQFPKLPADAAAARAVILQFAEDLKANRFDKDDGTLPTEALGLSPGQSIRQIFNPTYVRLDVSDDGKRLDTAELATYDWKEQRVE